MANEFVAKNGLIVKGSASLQNALTVGNGGTGAVTLTGMIKGNGTSAFSAGVDGTDYLSPTTLPSTIHAASQKSIPVDADELALIDSEASNILKRMSWQTVRNNVFKLPIYFYSADAATPLTTNSIMVVDPTALSTNRALNVPTGGIAGDIIQVLCTGDNAASYGYYFRGATGVTVQDIAGTTLVISLTNKNQSILIRCISNDVWRIVTTDFSSEVFMGASKTTLATADKFLLSDSADSKKSKSIAFSDLKNNVVNRSYTTLAPTSAVVTCAENTVNILDLSGLTANNSLRVPAGGVPGNWIIVVVSAESASNYTMTVRGNAGVTVQGTTGAFARFSLLNSYLALECIANDVWEISNADNATRIFYETEATSINDTDLFRVNQGGTSPWRDVKVTWANTKATLKTYFDTLYSTVNGAVPIGAIVMWAGTIATIPANWALCDGNNGTPNLSSKFIMGSTSDLVTNTTGGSNTTTLTTNELPAHTHSVGAQSGLATGTESAGHTHTGTTGTESAYHQHAPSDSSNFVTFTPGGGFPAGSWQFNSIGTGYEYYNSQTASQNALHTHSFTTGGASVTHTHSFTVPATTTGSTGTGSSYDSRPAFYALAFIQRKS